MSDKIKEISMWFLEQGIGVAQDILEEKLQEAYQQGLLDAYCKQIDTTLDNILYNTKQRIKSKMQELYEKNFYVIPSEEDAAQMRAYEYLNANLDEIIKDYREN